MTHDIQITHEQFEQQIAAYLADGLNADERIAFDAHAAQCAVCAARLESARGVDRGLLDLFTSEAPAADFEDRVVNLLREKSRGPRMRVRLNLRPRISVHPMLIRAAGVAVAAGFLATAGYVASNKLAPHRQTDVAMKSGHLGVSQEMADGVAKKVKGTIVDDMDDWQPTTQPSAPDDAEKFQAQKLSADDLRDALVAAQAQSAPHTYSADLESGTKSTWATSVNGTKDLVLGTLGGLKVDTNGSPLVGPRPDNILDGDHRVANDSALLPTDSSGGRIADSISTLPQSNLQAQARSQPGFVILSDGADGVYGSIDDLTKFGSLDDAGVSAKSDKTKTDTQSMADSGPILYSRATFGPSDKAVQQSGQSRTITGDYGDYFVFPENFPKIDSNRMLASDTTYSTMTINKDSLTTRNGKFPNDAPASLMSGQNSIGDMHGANPVVNSINGFPPVVLASNTPATTPTPTGAPAQSAPPVQSTIDLSRKIIRHGDMTFEVDSFDSAFLQISKIAAEENGFITSSSSDKLDNGKMSGTIVVRLAPENLDILVLKLRGLGDLKGQSIAADDITKQYTDLQSELRAAQSMQDRMLDIIKDGKGEVKDLVAAEKELGVWREKVEVLTGEINYYNNLVALSTLTIHVTEHDIRQSGIASEHETVDMGIEAEDVEKARQAALKIIDDAQGRIIQSDLKQEAEGEYSATVVAQVPPEAAGPVIDHLRQIGRVARLEMGRDQTAPNGAQLLPGAHIEHAPTQIQISIYNLASRQPRHIVNLSVAAPDVEASYDQIKTQVAAAGGRIVDSALTRSNAWKTIGSLTVEVPAEKAESVLLQIRAQGDVMHLDRSESKDLQNTTDEKRGFVVTLASLSSIAPRQTINLSLTPAPGSNVTDAYRTLLDAAVAAHATVLAAQVQQNGAVLEFDLSTDQQSAIESAISKSIDSADGGRVTARDSAQSNDMDNTLATRVKYKIALATPDTLGPRVVEERWLAASDVRSAYANILAAAQTASGQILSAQIQQAPNSESLDGELEFVVLQRSDKDVESAIAASTAGVVQVRQVVATDPNSATDRKIGLKLHIYDVNDLAPRQTTTMTVETSDPEQARINLQVEALNLQGRIVTQRVTKEEGYTDQMTVDVPAARGQELLDWARNVGKVRSIDQQTSSVIPDAPFTHVRLNLTLTGEAALVGQDQGLWASFRAGLGTGLHGLLYSLQLIIIGLLVVTPFAVLLWAGKRLLKWARKKPSPHPKPA